MKPNNHSLESQRFHRLSDLQKQSHESHSQRSSNSNMLEPTAHAKDSLKNIPKKFKSQVRLSTLKFKITDLNEKHTEQTTGHTRTRIHTPNHLKTIRSLNRIRCEKFSKILNYSILKNIHSNLNGQ